MTTTEDILNLNLRSGIDYERMALSMTLQGYHDWAIKLYDMGKELDEMREKYGQD